jgi:hypothetical protein
MCPPARAGSPRIQPKLKIGAVSDPLEQEADRLAEHVMRSPEGGAARNGQPGATHARAPIVRRLCRECEEEQDKETVRRKPAAGSMPQRTSLPDEQSLIIGGDPLPAPIRHFYEPRFDHDFRDVRIHSGAAAERYNKALNAHAFTYGNHIWMGAGQAVARTSLLAHELAHVVQQSASRGTAQPASVRRAPDKYANLSIPQLRRLVSQGDKGAVEALQARYAAMSNGQLAAYARGSKDLFAQKEYERRLVPGVKGTPQGRFSKDGVQDALTNDIKANRTTTGIARREPTAVTPDVEVEGGTVGAARTDIPGLEDRAFVGQSKRAGGPGYNPKSNFPPETNVETLPQTHGHAEQHIADQLEEALAKIPREQLKGRKVWMLIEQEVCSTCGQGAANLETAAGVLKKLSLKYPELTFEIKSLQGSSLIVLKGTQTAAAAAEGAGTTPGAAAGEEAKSVQVETKIEVTKSVRNADGTTVSEVEYNFGKSLDEINSTAPPGTSVPQRVTIRVTQNADGSLASVESLSGQPQAMAEALAQKTLAGVGETAAAAEGAAEGTATAAATTGRNAALLFKGLRIGGTAAFAIITAYQLWTATPKQRPRVLASAAGGLAGGALGTYLICNLALDVETAGWGLVICGLLVGGAAAYGGSKASEAAYDVATETDLDRAYKALGGKRQNEIGIFNFLVGKMGSDGCVDAAFVEQFMRTFPEWVNDTETVLIAAQLADASIAGVPRVANLPSRRLRSPSDREVVCPACHGRSVEELTGRTTTPAEIQALNAIPACSSVTGQALAPLRSAVKNLPPRPRVQVAHAPPQPPPSDPRAHANPPGYKPPDPSSRGFPTVEQQLGTVCPNCHTANEGKYVWKDLSPGLGGTDGQMSEETAKLLQQWATKGQ